MQGPYYVPRMIGENLRMVEQAGMGIMWEQFVIEPGYRWRQLLIERLHAVEPWQ
jgi:hypothetical protein